MKKLLFIALTLMIFVEIQAQEKSSSPTMWIGGEVTYGSLSDLDYTVGPSWGMMLNENMGIGVTAIYSGGDNASAWSVEPYFRYYIPVVDKFSFYGDGFIGFGGGDNDIEDEDKGDYSSTNLGVKAGLQYWFTPKWSLAASTSILEYSQKDDKDGEFGIGASFNTVNFSFFFHF